MRAKVVLVVTLVFGLGCVGELLDRERMPVVTIDVQVTGECTWAPPIDTSLDTSAPDSAAADTACPEEWGWSCPVSRIHDDGRKIIYESDDEDISDLDGLLWLRYDGDLGRRGTTASVAAEIRGDATVTAIRGTEPELYTVDASGRVEPVNGDFDVEFRSDQEVAFAYDVDWVRYTEVHTVTSTEERRVEPRRIAIFDYCCATGPSPVGAAGWLLLAVLTVFPRRRAAPPAGPPPAWRAP